MKEFDDVNVLDTNNPDVAMDQVEKLDEDMGEEEDYLIDDYMDDVDIPTNLSNDISDHSVDVSLNDVRSKDISPVHTASVDPIIEDTVQDDLLKDFSDQIVSDTFEDTATHSSKQVEDVPILFDDDIVSLDNEPIHSTTDPVLEREMDREELLEEAQSHTTQYNPFEPQQPEVSPIELDKDSKKNQNGMTFIIILFIVLIIAIFLIPKIASIFG